MDYSPMNRRWIPAIAGAWLLVAFLPARGSAANWLTDLPSAQATAKAENKIVLIDFTGSDWCGWCIRLRNEVFSKPEFDSFANDNLVLVEVDFPHQKPQEDALKQANVALAQRFQVKGFPTLVVLNSDGKELGTIGYLPGGPQAFIAALASMSGIKTPASTASRPGQENKKHDAPPEPLFNGAPTFPPPKFNDLVLKGISGPKNNRLAMINNRTLSVGETDQIKVGETQLKVKCLEIRADSVLVSLDGAEQKELRMRGGL
jgi:thioredoxin-related protein